MGGENPALYVSVRARSYYYVGSCWALLGFPSLLSLPCAAAEPNSPFLLLSFFIPFLSLSLFPPQKIDARSTKGKGKMEGGEKRTEKV